jgi:hypothetical protein
MRNSGNLQGLIPILGGVVGILAATGILPRSPRDPERMALWRREFGPLMMVLCPIIIIMGVFELIGLIK